MHKRITTSQIRRGFNFLCWSQWDGNDIESESIVCSVDASFANFSIHGVQFN